MFFRRGGWLSGCVPFDDSCVDILVSFDRERVDGNVLGKRGKGMLFPTGELLAQMQITREKRERVMGNERKSQEVKHKGDKDDEDDGSRFRGSH